MKVPPVIMTNWSPGIWPVSFVFNGTTYHRSNRKGRAFIYVADNGKQIELRADNDKQIELRA